MKTEQLLELGIEDKDVQNAIFKLYNEGLSAEKTKTTEAKNALKDYKEEVEKMQENLISKEDFEKLKAEKDNVESELTKAKEDHEKELTSIKFNYKLNEKLKEFGARDAKLIKAVLDNDSISYEEDEIKGLDEQIEEIKKTYDYLFVQSEPQKKTNFSQRMNSGGTGSLTSEEFMKLSYTEKNNLYREDPDLYNQLAKQ